MNGFKHEPENMEAADNVQVAVDTAGNAQVRGAAPKPEKPLPIFLQVTSNFREILHEIDKLSEEEFSRRVNNDLVKITPA